ncbi:3-isopropylmalate dehydrogenase [Falsiroseomonas selenitidurans]|uniref:3-isopropylmalate dehydrogenase n=1 Tax=Falsiroseomonas selenitidurans TaxID=2716335 RepID=A0ABX1E5E2_9PROT|nr:3-isopropylmalate dehydrogenase [Falsiroseomonas selenitidurans]NKC30727.1 3-isopropylmalate dehydrogenase [Falsiroseomonas selenitidurans]OYW10154.1 MAG: 3-isopropylmalate dehydrogenase [Rhodospirillales bacterium 12-71-4]
MSQPVFPPAPRPLHVVALGGDGIGPEVTAQALRVLRHMQARHALPLVIEEMPYGNATWRATGRLVPAATDAAIGRADAILFGAADSLGRSAMPAEERARGSLLALRRRLNLFANIRPVRTERALDEVSPFKARTLRGVDLAFVRELSGGIYFGEPRGIERLEDGQRRGINTHSYTEEQVVRAARFAFALARGRRGRVTSVDKANVMEAGALWRQVVGALHHDEFRDVALDHMLADTCALMLNRDPQRFDVILTDNLFGDLLSDAAAGLAGSLGLLPSASLSPPAPDGRRRALYEPVHGSAPDIAGKGIANPLAAILSAALLLRWSAGAEAAAREVEAAVSAALSAGARCADIALPGEAVLDTAGMGDAVLARL